MSVQIVTTLEELEALPHNAIVVSKNEYGETQCFQKGIGQYGHTYWMPTHDDGTTVTQAIPLPAQIIYQGEQETQ